MRYKVDLQMIPALEFLKAALNIRIVFLELSEYLSVENMIGL